MQDHRALKFDLDRFFSPKPGTSGDWNKYDNCFYCNSMSEKPISTLNQEMLSGNTESKKFKLLRSSALATWLFSTSFWIGISFYILYNPESVPYLFIDSVPYSTYWITGMCMFVISFISLIVYVVMRNSSKPFRL